MDILRQDKDGKITQYTYTEEDKARMVKIIKNREKNKLNLKKL